MKTKIRSRLDQYTVHCPTCGHGVQPGSVVEGRPSGVHDRAPGHQPSAGMVPVGKWDNWATDLQIDQWKEEDL